MLRANQDGPSKIAAASLRDGLAMTTEEVHRAYAEAQLYVCGQRLYG